MADTLNKLAADMAIHARHQGPASAAQIAVWTGRLLKLTKRPEGDVPVMLEGNHVLAFGRLDDGR